MIQHLRGDCRQVLKTLPERSIHTCITSPPYWGLRDYGVPPLASGGDPACSHTWGAEAVAMTDQPDKRRWNHAVNGRGEAQPDDRTPNASQIVSLGRSCPCGAWLGSLGLEPTPELYVAHLVEVFREVKRVLRDDGTFWLNLGDSYAGSWGNQGRKEARGTQRPILSPMAQRLDGYGNLDRESRLASVKPTNISSGIVRNVHADLGLGRARARARARAEPIVPQLVRPEGLGEPGSEGRERGLARQARAAGSRGEVAGGWSPGPRGTMESAPGTS